MQLPYIDEAHVSELKISDYLLADDHPAGRSKALFFRNLGFRKDQPAVLRLALLQHATVNDVSSQRGPRLITAYPLRGVTK